jgi:hypothetical protein
MLVPSFVVIFAMALLQYCLLRAGWSVPEFDHPFRNVLDVTGTGRRTEIVMRGRVRVDDEMRI